MSSCVLQKLSKLTFLIQIRICTLENNFKFFLVFIFLENVLQYFFLYFNDLFLTHSYFFVFMFLFQLLLFSYFDFCFFRIFFYIRNVFSYRSFRSFRYNMLSFKKQYNEYKKLLYYFYTIFLQKTTIQKIQGT